jgi:hypothetical protein
MRKLVLMLTLLCGFNWLAWGQNVKVQLCNKTGFQIDSLIVNKVLIGSLEPSACSKTIFYTDFHFDSGHPNPVMTAFVNGIKTTSQHGRCGTELNTVKKGEWVFDVTIVSNAGAIGLVERER